MRASNTRVNTVFLLCHLLLAPALLTSQLRVESPSRNGLPQNAQFPSPRDLFARDATEAVVIKADLQEKDGDTYRLKGKVEIEFRDFIIKADEITYNEKTGDIVATGNLVMDGGSHDEHIEASRAELNRNTQTGKFWDVLATTGVRFRGREVTLTTDDPFTFTGKMVEKVSRNKYVVHNGTVTSCRIPDPKWTFNAQRVEVELGGSARIYNTTFRVKRVPVLYLPFAAHPAATNLGRQSGFLVPTFGASSRKGTIFGQSFYWAINRSMDATLGAEYYSSRGWAQHGEFRSKPTQHSTLSAQYFGVLDRGFGPTKIDQGGQDIKLDAEALFPKDFRGVASLNYLSSFVFRLAFTEQFSQAVNSEVKSVAFLSKPLNGYFFNTSFARYQNFQSATRGDVITMVHAPSGEVSSVERRIWKTPFFWSGSAALEGVSRREPTFKTNDLVGRFDLHPRISLPVFFKGWTFRPEVGLRTTYYTQRKSAAAGIGTPINDALNRRALDFSVELRPPTLGKIFEKQWLGRTWKHTIEPRVMYHAVGGVSGFQNVIRFDYRDILSNTNEVEYGIIHRLFSKKARAECSAALLGAPCEDGPRDFITWEVSQRYYIDPDFGGAVINGRRNVLTTTADFTGIAFLTEPRRFSPIQSKLRMRATNNVDSVWQLDYDSKKGRINSSTAFVNYRFGDYFLGGSHSFFHSPGEIFVINPIAAPDKFNQFRFLTGYGGPSKPGFSLSTGIGFDVETGFLQYGSAQTSYNWDCCGVTMEYRRFALGRVRNENQFRFAFTLANIGTFGNLKRQEKLF